MSQDIKEFYFKILLDFFFERNGMSRTELGLIIKEMVCQGQNLVSLLKKWYVKDRTWFNY